MLPLLRKMHMNGVQIIKSHASSHNNKAGLQDNQYICDACALLTLCA
jgi:hypothetical protein